MARIDSDSVVFAIDLHKVLVRPNIKEIVRMMLFHKYLFLALFNAQVWYKILKDGALSQEKVDHIVQKYASKGITKELLIQLLNCQIKNNSTIHVFQMLHDKGYALYLASDIWQDLFFAVQKKFSFVTTLFKGYYTPNEQNGYYEKPDRRYYEHLKKYIAQKGDGDKKIIFVDNNRENVKAAQKEGLIAIQYKNAGSLIKDLKSLGFLLF